MSSRLDNRVFVGQPVLVTERPDAAEPTAIDLTSIDGLVERVVQSGVVSVVNRARLVTDGMQHVVVVLDEKLVARFPRDQAATVSLRDEAVLLGHLAGHVTAPLPVPLHVDESFTLHRMLRGSITSRAALDSLDRRARERLLDDVGRFLGELSSTVVADLARSVATTSQDRLRLLCQRAEECLVPLMWRHQRVWFEEIVAAVESMSFAHTPCVIHGDLAPYHVLHAPQSGELTGILDFGVAGLGDPAVDFGCLLAVWGEKFAAELTRTWPAAVELADRARLIALTLPLEWAVAAVETDAAGLGVAHLGHLAFDVGRIGSSFGPQER